MDRKIKVLFCTDGIFPQLVGGMQRHSRLLIEALAHYDDLELTVIHPHPQKVFDSKYGINEISLKGKDPDKVYLLEAYRYSQRVFEVAQKLDDYIIYSQGLSVWYGIERLRYRLIINPHGLEPFQGITIKDNLIGVPFRHIFSKLFNNARYVVSLGGKLTSILQNQIRTNKTAVVVLPNAVTEPESEHVTLHAAGDQLTALFVGRFAANKGIHVLMKAIQELNDEGTGRQIRFLLAGKGPLYEHYVAMNNQSNVEFLGFVTDEQLADLYAKSDFFVLPTLFEGMPTVVLEAMSNGLPVIVSNVGATAELVNQTNGFLIKKNSVKELKKAIVQFTKLSHKEREGLGKNSLQKVKEEFTWNKVAERHHLLLRVLYSQVFSDDEVPFEY